LFLDIKMANLRAAVRAGVLAVATALLTQLSVGIILVQRRALIVQHGGRHTVPWRNVPWRTFDVEQQRPYDAEGLGGKLPNQAMTGSRRRAAPLPLAAPPLPPLLPPLPQPDELTRQLAIPFRCGERIPPESVHTTSAGTHRITVHVRATYRGMATPESLHHFGYTVDFTNAGTQTVQLLTRHIVFVDDSGRTEEVKGPGAKGAMPMIEPGKTWSYSSKTRLRTARGSMHGWFTFEAIGNGHDEREEPSTFAASVARLALSPQGRAEDVPCALPVTEGSLPGTSVHRTERVFVGAVVALVSHDEDVGRYKYVVDLQINNALHLSVFVVGYRFEVIDAHGQRFQHVGQGVGSHHGKKLDVIKMPPGSVMRIQSEMPQIYTATATIRGVLLAHAVPADFDSESLREPNEGVTEPMELVVAPLGVSKDGSPVPEQKPLGFLAD
jgi:ApaG protein